MKTLRDEIDLSISEAVFQSQVIQLAHIHGWRVAHFRTGIGTQGRYMTPVQADGAGFPDLVMVKTFPDDNSICLIAELKSEKGKLTIEQEEWLNQLNNVEGFYCFMWKPHDFNSMAQTLQSKGLVDIIDIWKKNVLYAEKYTK